MTTYIIETSSPIKNPCADRRSKDWNKQPLIKQGSRFVVRENGSVKDATARFGWETPNSALTKAIVAASKRVEPVTVAEMKAVADCDWGGDFLLEMLLKLGKITFEDFKLVAIQIEKEEV